MKQKKQSCITYIWNNISESNKVVLLFGILINIYGIYLTRQANQLIEKDIEKDFEIAEKSGSFDKPNFQLFIGSVPMQIGFSDVKIVYGSKPNSNRGFHISNIPWGITNKGKKTVEDLSINFLYHAKHALAVPDSLSQIDEAAKAQITRRAFLNDELPHDLIS